MYKTLKNTNSQTGAIVYIGHATTFTLVQDIVCKIQKNTTSQTGTTVSIGQATTPSRVQNMVYKIQKNTNSQTGRVSIDQAADPRVNEAGDESWLPSRWQLRAESWRTCPIVASGVSFAVGLPLVDILRLERL